MKNKIKNIIPILGIILGVAIILYFPLTDLWEAHIRQQVFDNLDKKVSVYKENPEKKKEILDQANSYNAVLAGKEPIIPRDQIWEYNRQLTNEDGNVTFGQIIIPYLGINMPLYHGTGEETLSSGVGHLENTSLPIGGYSTHSVLSGHSGMAKMRAFDNITKMKNGDVFVVKVLGDYYAYKVFKTETVLPKEAQSLKIYDGEDISTLVTCVPYGVNTHRFLVHGARTEVPDGYFDQKQPIKEVLKDRRNLALIAASVIILLLIISLVIRRVRRRYTYEE